MDDFTDTEALAAIVRIIGGNFRIIHHLFIQIERILEINHLQTATKEVVEEAREQLVWDQSSIDESSHIRWFAETMRRANAGSWRDQASHICSM